MKDRSGSIEKVLHIEEFGRGKDIIMTIEFDYNFFPGERQTWEHPGSPPEVEFLDSRIVEINDYELSSSIPANLFFSEEKLDSITPSMDEVMEHVTEKERGHKSEEIEREIARRREKESLNKT